MGLIQKLANESVTVETPDGEIELKFPTMAEVRTVFDVIEHSGGDDDPTTLLRAGAVALSVCTGESVEDCERYVLSRMESPAILEAMKMCGVSFDTDTDGDEDGDGDEDESDGGDEDDGPFPSRTSLD